MTNGAAALFMRTAYQTTDIYFGDTPLGSCGCLPLDLPPLDQSEGELDAVQIGACGCGCGSSMAAG